MRRLRQVSRRLGREERGYTLIELLVVMAILLTVMAALTTAFTSGVNAELRASRRYQAQLNARLALDRLRSELHCASALTTSGGTPASSITVTLPDVCPGSDTSVTYATQSGGTNRWTLTRTGASGTVTIADYLTTATPFTYYAPASGTLGKLHVDLPVNVNPSDSTTAWLLSDDIVLRNTDRS